MAGRRARAVATAGDVIHGHARAPGQYMRTGIAECGARGSAGAEFTTWSKYVSCDRCLAVIFRRRLKAKGRLAAVEAAL